MCLLINKPSDKKIDRKNLLAGFEANGDGIGMAYVEDGELVVDKGYADFDEFYEAYKKVEEGNQVMIHFRAASPAMVISGEMCHPFEINDNMVALDDGSNRFTFAVGHNGRLPWNPSKDGMSDTYMFTEEFLTPLLGQNPYFLDYQHGIMLLEKFVGDNNKLVIYRFEREKKELKHYIINPKGGNGMKQAREVDGIWYSNDSYIPWAKASSHCYPGQGCLDVDDAHAAYHYYNRTNNTTGGAGGSSSAKTEVNAQTTQASGQNSQISKEIDSYGDEIAKSIQSQDFGKDAVGWMWDFSRDCWRNVNTGHVVAFLATRPKRPRYMEQRMLREAAIEKEKSEAALAKLRSTQASTLGAKSPPPVDTNWPEKKSGSIVNTEQGKVIQLPPQGGDASEESEARFLLEGVEMQRDLELLSDEAFEDKWGTIPDKRWREAAKASRAAITVPRDPGVIEKQEDRIDCLLQDHFTKAECRVIFAEASKFWGSEFGKKTIKQTPRIQRVNYMVQALSGVIGDADGSLLPILKYIAKKGLVHAS